MAGVADVRRESTMGRRREQTPTKPFPAYTAGRIRSPAVRCDPVPSPSRVAGRVGRRHGPRQTRTREDSSAAVSSGRTSTAAWLTSRDRTSNGLSGVSSSASAMNRSWSAIGIARSAVSRT